VLLKDRLHRVALLGRAVEDGEVVGPQALLALHPVDLLADPADLLIAVAGDDDLHRLAALALGLEDFLSWRERLLAITLVGAAEDRRERAVVLLELNCLARLKYMSKPRMLATLAPRQP
jgi:hypothetical protein